jgi:hypothetical protein
MSTIDIVAIKLLLPTPLCLFYLCWLLSWLMGLLPISTSPMLQSYGGHTYYSTPRIVGQSLYLFEVRHTPTSVPQILQAYNGHTTAV